MQQNDLLNILAQTNLDVKKVSKYTKKTIYILTKNQEKYILRFVTNKEVDTYDYLISSQVEALYPVKKINYNGYNFYLFKYQTNNADAISSVRKLKDSLMAMHKATSKEVVLRKENLQNLYKTYQVLDARFTNLEMIIRQIELMQVKDDNCWIILSKYRVFLLAKKTMYALQQKIHKEIDAQSSVTFALIHGSPSLCHYKGGRIISFSNAYYGFVVSDIAKFYVENDHLSTNMYELVNSWLNEYKAPIYKLYFKFLVLYIYMVNLRLTNLKSYEQLNNYIKISDKIKEVIYRFKTYK